MSPTTRIVKILNMVYGSYLQIFHHISVLDILQIISVKQVNIIVSYPVKPASLSSRHKNLPEKLLCTGFQLRMCPKFRIFYFGSTNKNHLCQVWDERRVVKQLPSEMANQFFRRMHDRRKGQQWKTICLPLVLYCPP